jgi:hypothetical protein
MRHGFMHTTLKQKLSHQNGCQKGHHDRRKRDVRSHNKVMLTVFFFFFYSEGIVHHELLPQGNTVTKEYYLELMKRLREAIRKERPNAWRSNQMDATC